MKQRNLAVLLAGLFVATAIAWAGGMFDASGVPEGAIASDSVGISVGDSNWFGSVVAEVRSMSLRGVTVFTSVIVLLAAVGWSIAGRGSETVSRGSARMSGPS